MSAHEAPDQDALFTRHQGRLWFCGLEVQRHKLEIAGHSFNIDSLRDASELLDQPDFAEHFFETDLAPYGLELWPAAIMLAEHILLGESGNDRTALELGCGLGLVSIAAASHAWQVTATDNDENALKFARHNAALNSASASSFSPMDWHTPERDHKYERVYAADVLYELKSHEPVLRCVDAVLADSGSALIADPGRSTANHFDKMAEGAGFSVHVHSSSAPGPASESIVGRIFQLHRC